MDCYAETTAQPMRPFHGLSRSATIKLTHYRRAPKTPAPRVVKAGANAWSVTTWSVRSRPGTASVLRALRGRERWGRTR
jgi:hypothetical protein